MLISEIKPFVRYARYMELQPDSKFNANVPLDARLFYTKSGSGVILADGVEYEMKKGAVLIVNSGTRYHLASPNEAVTYAVFNFDYSFKHAHINVPVAPVSPESYRKDKLVEFCSFSDCEELGEVFYLTGATFLEKKLSAIIKEYFRKFLYHDIKSSALLCECICESLRVKCSRAVSGDKSSVDEILTYIHENYHKPLTNIMLGEEFSYHPNYISSVVKLATGMPLHKYLIHVRLLRAVEMLENSSKAVGEIALMCGFCDIGYFSAYFKKQFGTAPTHYRKNG